MKQTGMLVVSCRGVNFQFWSRLGCSGQSANILSCQGLVQGSVMKHIIMRRETEFKFSFFFLLFSFLGGHFQGSKFASVTPRLVSFRGHKKLEPRPDGLLQGLNSKFSTSIPVCSMRESPPGARRCKKNWHDLKCHDIIFQITPTYLLIALFQKGSQFLKTKMLKNDPNDK